MIFFDICMGFVVFFGTIKCIRLLRYNSRIYLFISTLQVSPKELFSFMFILFIIFIDTYSNEFNVINEI